MKKSETILVMAGGTGGHIFGSGIARVALALVCAANVPGTEVRHG